LTMNSGDPTAAKTCIMPVIANHSATRGHEQRRSNVGRAIRRKEWQKATVWYQGGNLAGGVAEGRVFRALLEDSFQLPTK